MPQVTTKFELADGRILRCEYGFMHDPGGWDAPPETDVGEPTYYLDGDEVTVEELPKGLDVIAQRMYECGSGEYGYKESFDDGDDYEPDFDC
jgi:hypothetical protein